MEKLYSAHECDHCIIVSNHLVDTCILKASARKKWSARYGKNELLETDFGVFNLRDPVEKLMHAL